jgi:hypothetical protein
MGVVESCHAWPPEETRRAFRAAARGLENEAREMVSREQQLRFLQRDETVSAEAERTVILPWAEHWCRGGCLRSHYIETIDLRSSMK